MKKTKAKNKKISIIFIMLILIMSVSIGLYATEPETTDIVCADVNLYDALVEDLDDYVYRADRTTKTIRIPTTNIPLITELKLTGNSSAKITDLTGLEYFTSLENLNLSGNSITSVEPISGLTTLKTLNISTNQATITDLNTLSNLTNLIDVNFASSRLGNVDFMSTYTQLQVLDVSGNTISSLDPLVGITTLKKLNIANNASFNRFQTNICNHTGLTYLDISGTAIQVLDGIETNLRNLETLNLRYLDVDLDPIVARYKDSASGEYFPYLDKLKVLDISYTTKSISFKHLSYLTTLTHLYMKDVVGKWNNPSTTTKLSLSGIYELQGLQYINLASNNISSIEEFVYEKYDENILVEKKVLGATEIYLQDNKIPDLSPLTGLVHPIKILNLSYNKISETSPLDYCNFTSDAQVDLRYQDVSLKVFKKASVDQYIILPSIFQDSKTPGSFIYTEDTDFLIKCNDEVDEESIRLNKEEPYLEPGNLNVIINKTKSSDDLLTLEITGTGMATGSKLTFSLGTSTGNVDSIFFKDPNLCQAIKDNLAKEEFADKVKYIKNAHLIMNINNSAIKAIDRLHLASKNISDLSGMENFTGLTNLILSNNLITTIDPLQYCTKMLNLEVPNNNLGDNNTAITQMTKIQQLDLSNTNMTNIESIHTLIDYWTRKKSFPLTNLRLSGNGFTNEQLQRISKITSLTTLIVANNELNEVESFENLKSSVTILDVSQNAIEDISTLGAFTNLISLNLSGNKIKDISPIANCAKLNELDFSANRIENISSLSSIAGSGNLVILNMNNNKIQDVSAVDRDQISQTLSAESQKITQVIPEGTEGSMIIELPQIFKAADNANSRFYDNGRGAKISVVNKEDGVDVSEYCAPLSSDKLSIAVNVDKLTDNNIIVIKLQDGNADNTTLSIGAPLKGTITYNPSNETLTNQDITATITFNRTATVINNDGKNTYTFTENGEFTFEYVDEYGFEGTAVAKVENIDKVAPQGTVTQKLEDGKVVVTIEVNEEITELEGWEKSTTEEGKIILTKTYEDDSNEIIKIVDLAGNSTDVKVEVKFDKTAPTITGVEDGEKYENPVTPVIEDENLSEITLTKDETAIDGYQSGTEITESGNYVLTAKDTYGNTTTVSFEIELDQVAPTITGVEDGEKYENSVTPVIEDKNLNEVTLTKNGTVVENYQSGTEITESGNYVLTAKDKAGNTTTVSFEIEIPQEISDKITSDEVTVNEEETRIEDINPGITVSQLKEKLNAEMEYEIVDKNGNIVSGTSKIGTGYKVKMENDKTYTIIVSGDCNGDGSVKLSDMSLVNRYRLNKTTLEGEYFLAADVTGDGKVDFKDLVKINRFRLNKITEL